MAKTATVSNEEIIAAIMQSSTIKEAAGKCGLAPRTIYDRMQDRDFRAMYAAAKNEIIRGAVFNLNRQLSAAVDSIAEIMTDEKVNPATRLQAAQTILNNAGKLSEQLAKGESTAIDEGSNSLDNLLADLFK